MALIKCSECQKEVSDKAAACPACGNPMGQMIVTIQQTGKVWKLMSLIFGTLFVIGLFLFLRDWANISYKVAMTGIGAPLTFFSFLGVVIGRVGAWWNHA